MTVFKWTLLINYGYLIHVLLRWICIKVKQCMDQLQRSSDTATTGESFYKVESILVTWEHEVSKGKDTWTVRTVTYTNPDVILLNLLQCLTGADPMQANAIHSVSLQNLQWANINEHNIFQTSYSLVALVWGQFFHGSWRYPWQPSSLPAQHHEAKSGQHRKPSSPKQRRHFPWTRW